MANVLECEYWSEKRLEKELGIKLDATFTLNALTSFWKAKGAGTTKSIKNPVMLDKAELLAHPKFAPHAHKIAQAGFDYRGATLTAEVPRAFGAKNLISQPANVWFGSPRQASLLTVADKMAGEWRGIVEGSRASTLRTAYIAAWSLQAFYGHLSTVKVHVIGAAEVGPEVVRSLAAAVDHLAGLGIGARKKAANWIEHVSLSSTSESSIGAASQLNNEGLPFKVIATPPADESSFLSNADMIITAAANPEEVPMFSYAKIKKGGVLVVDLSINSLPLEVFNDANILVCDEVHTVAHRGVQSLPIWFKSQGRNMDEVAKQFGIKEIPEVKPHSIKEVQGKTIIVSSSGLAAIDLWFAVAVLTEVAAKKGKTLFA
jgi:alanine dehydrogenase